MIPLSEAFSARELSSWHESWSFGTSKDFTYSADVSGFIIVYIEPVAACYGAATRTGAGTGSSRLVLRRSLSCKLFLASSRACFCWRAVLVFDGAVSLPACAIYYYSSVSLLVNMAYFSFTLMISQSSFAFKLMSWTSPL